MKITFKNGTILETVEAFPPHTFKVKTNDIDSVVALLTEYNLSKVTFETEIGTKMDYEDLKRETINIEADNSLTVHLRAPNEIEVLKKTVERQAQEIALLQGGLIEIGEIVGGDE